LAQSTNKQYIAVQQGEKSLLLICPFKHKESIHTLLISRSMHRVTIADRLFLHNIQHDHIRPACQTTCIRKPRANQLKVQK